jgi:hypothetical protein
MKPNQTFDMKKILIAVLLLSCTTAFAQTTSVVTRMTSAEYAEYVKNLPKVKDKNIYDQEGNVVDSAKARQMVKTFEYKMIQTIPPGQTEYKLIITKVNHAQEESRDKTWLAAFWPKSPKLAEGTTLDLSPLAKHTDVGNLEGKAIVLLFRNNNYAFMFNQINDAIANNIDNNKFEVFAITGLDYASAKAAQKQMPILNAHHIIDAQDLINFYETKGDATVVVTNLQHQIIYAARSGPAMTPRTLNKLLKAL